MNLGQFIGEMILHGEILKDQQWRKPEWYDTVERKSFPRIVHPVAAPQEAVVARKRERTSAPTQERIEAILVELPKDVALSSIEIWQRGGFSSKEVVQGTLRLMHSRGEVIRHGIRKSYTYQHPQVGHE